MRGLAAQLTLVSVALLAAACKSEKLSRSAMADDLRSDLQLASATQNMKISADEIAPRAHEELALRPKAAPKGPKVIRTNRPAIRASAAPVEAAQVDMSIPEVQAIASAPAPAESPSPDVPPMARPTPISMPAYPSAGTAPDGAGGPGGILAGVFGAVIRGGIVGDVDRCDPRSGRGGRPVGGDIFTLPGRIGMGGSRIPATPIGRRVR